MLVFVGLGNPGISYSLNRHNAGFLFLDELASVLGDSSWSSKENLESEVIKFPELLLVKPTTFMNASGKAVKKVMDYYNLTFPYLYVVHDDLDIVFGDYKIQRGVGPKLHNGVTSVEEELRTTQFFRIRIGVDNRTPENRTAGDVYSLQNFTKEELSTLKQVYKKIIEELKISS